ncbi:MAG: TonB family protein [Bacteroidota bacterium]
MNKNDWIGLGTSIGFHGLLILLFALVTGASARNQTMGYIEVDFGPLAEGRAVQRSVEERTQPEEQPTEREPQPKPTSSPPEEAKPVNLPEQQEIVRDEERVETPETESIAPERPQDQEERQDAENVDATPQAPPGTGAVDGSQGAETGQEGEGRDDEASAPYQIEGLNRSAVYAPVPPYTEQVNAVIRVRITVDPQGRIVQRIPLIKGSPALEQSVMQTLERWRFDPLPPNVPRENQTGTVTFSFRLE